MSGARRRWAVALAALVAVTPLAMSEAGHAARVGHAARAVPPDGPILVPAGAQVLKGHYIVQLKGSSATSLTTRYGGKAEHTYRKALHGFALAATEAQARRLAADPNVLRVEADTLVWPADTKPYPIWSLDRVDQRSSVLDDEYTYPASAGQGVTAYILDSGVRTAHEEFGGRASVGFDAYDDGWNGQDCNVQGHGTHVAGTVGGATYGVAPRANLVSVRVLSCAGPGPMSKILAGIDWVSQNAQRPAVANMSLGSTFSDLLNDAVAASSATGITYVVAAGNNDRDACNYSPASEPTAITVGASNGGDERARNWGGTEPGSNYGTCLDVFAPGENIRSASNVTDAASRVLRGTSMASPHVAGAAALVLAERPTATPAQVTQSLVGTATVGALKLANTDTSPNKLLYAGPDLFPTQAPAPGPTARR
ncbi:S8 family peptidase [Actinoplanes sp. NPDC051346]|uniref:S8 family peptidase n=1 Tax=Actinoplanes sp. NPDC051346 TaxID=3155048 RepID=UPI00343FE542